ncbi:hypothetical protein TWF696_000370 [Orbilia brochopaga]|uniref:Uncharacterized protein n=1 Tax=Orbilia brochopaga TaxID=3140254 RepID=A0AAV9VB35_9PEZI
MGSSKGKRPIRHWQVEQSPYILPAASTDTLPSLWEADSDGDSDGSTTVSLGPSLWSPNGSFGRPYMDGEGSKKRRKSSISESGASEIGSISNASQSTSHTMTPTSDLKGKKPIKYKSDTDLKSIMSDIMSDESEHKMHKFKKRVEKAKTKHHDKHKKKDKKPRPHVRHILRETLSLASLKQIRERSKAETHKKDNVREQAVKKQGVSVSSDPVKVYEESTSDADSRERLRNSSHMTAEIKLHFWRDNYRGKGRLGRIKEHLYKKRVRRMMKVMMELQAAMLAS